MPFFFAGCGLACAAAAAWAWVNWRVETDIQLGILVTLLVGAFLFLGLAYAIQVLNEIRRRLDR